MSKDNSNLPSTTNSASDDQAGGELYAPFSAQPTSFIETTFAGSLGISMHNEVSAQQSSRLTSLASTTNACKLLLQTKSQAAAPKSKGDKASDSDASGDSDEDSEPGNLPAIVTPEKPTQKPKKKWGFSLGALAGKGKASADASQGETPEAGATDGRVTNGQATNRQPNATMASGVTTNEPALVANKGEQ